MLKQLVPSLNDEKVSSPSSSTSTCAFTSRYLAQDDFLLITVDEPPSTSSSSTSSRRPLPDYEEQESRPLSSQWAQFLEAERFLNGGSRTYSSVASYTEMLPAYQPSNPDALFFWVPFVAIPQELVSISLANPDPQLAEFFLSPLQKVRFCIHPQFYGDPSIPSMFVICKIASLAGRDDAPPPSPSPGVRGGARRLREPSPSLPMGRSPLSEAIGKIPVVPTSSSRTTFVLNGSLPPHCLKLHCPLRISRFNRKLDGRDVAKSVSTSRELDQAVEAGVPFPSCFGFLPETIGISIGQGSDAWGFIVREMTPRPFVPGSERRTLYPLFSLYSEDLRVPLAPSNDSSNMDSNNTLSNNNNNNNTSHVHLLKTLVENSGLSPLDFVRDKVMFPIIESWCFLAREFGILAQAHGQNLLLEVNAKGLPTRIILRDLSTYMDRGMRAEKGRSNKNFPLPQGQTTFMSREEQSGYYSLTYDSFVGHHLFDYLAKIAHSFYQIEPRVLQKACREKFHQCFPEAQARFPQTVYYYSKECVDGFRQDVVDTGEVPFWR